MSTTILFQSSFIIFLSILCTNLYAQNDGFKVYDDSFDLQEVKIGTFLFEKPSEISFINIDSLVSDDHLHKIERKTKWPHFGLGNQGSPLRSMTWNFPYTLSPELGINVFNPYFFELKNMSLFQVDRPYTEIFISQGKAYGNSNRSLQNNMTLEAVFSRNLKYDMNLFMKYRRIKEAGPFNQDENKITAFQTGLIRLKEKINWSSYLIFTFNEIERQENGGLMLEDELYEEDIYATRSAIPTYLRDASTRFSNYNIQFKNKYGLLSTASNKLQLSHIIEWNTHLYKYFDKSITSSGDSAYYNNYINSDQGIRSIVSLKFLKNDFSISWNNPIINKMSFGIMHAKHYLDWDLDQIEENHVELYGILNFKIGRIRGENKLSIGLFDINSSHSLQSKLNIDLSHMGFIDIGLKALNKKNDLIKRKLVISQYEFWQFNFPHEDYYQLHMKYSLPNNYLSIGANYNIINQHTSFNIAAEPDNLKEAEHYLFYFLKSDVQYKSFGFKNNLFYRPKKSISFLYTPHYYSEHEVYYTTLIFNDRTTLRTGIEAQYFYNYTLPKYNPLIGNFYPGSTDAGFITMLDFYINLKVPQFKFYVLASNFMDIFQAQRYQWAENYPLHDWSIRFGIKWTYLD